MIEDLIKRYKEFKRKEGHSDEFYKYIAIQHFQQNWDINAEDFAGMLKFALSKHVHQIFEISLSAINHVAREKPDETRGLFENLFNETKDLYERIRSFSSEVEKMIKSIDPKLNGMQDERTISVYLTFRYPEKYTFYKSSFYTKYCKEIGEVQAGRWNKLPHYYKMINELKKSYVDNDHELWGLTNATLPENAWKDEQKNVLAQDILYVTLDQLKFSGKIKEPANVLNETETMKQTKIPQNLILYGPPGTGKTFELINNYVKFFTDKTDGKSKEIYTYELVSELKWWEVITLSLYELGKAKVNELIQPSIVSRKNQSDGK